MRTSLLLLGLPLALALPQSDVDASRAALNKHRAEGVKDCFKFAWHGYYKYAFPNDELHPVSNTFGNTRNGWGASAVDALSTALVMKLPKVTEHILDHISTIDYSQTDDIVSLFETTIRYLAGMLSGYDLLNGPLKGLVDDTDKVDALLEQSKSLADILKFAFNTPSGIPYNNIYINNQTNDGSKSNGLATAGSLVMEWTRLSDLTGDKEYAKLAQKAENWLLHPSSEAFPGLVGSNIAISNGSFLDKDGSWNGGDDSFYEYLIKMWVYDSERFGEYRDRWIKAAESSMKYLASHPSSRPDLTFLAAFNNKELQYVSQHLTCFDGGNFILGGETLGRQDLVDFGLKLVDGCRNTYTQTVTGIGPEVFSWNTTTLPANQTAFYDRAGFWIEDGFYDLRPEVIESYYYAYRSTKDPKYQDWAWEGFQHINKTARANSGFSSFNNVNIAGGGAKDDNQESFLFAEVMKYSYLIHAEDAPYQVLHNGKNDFVFNTEAHPFKVAGKHV